MVRVADNGSGMTEDVREKIFQPFWTKKAGTGLGLVIVKKMVSRMQGTVDVESVLGRGTEVTLAFGAEPPA